MTDTKQNPRQAPKPDTLEQVTLDEFFDREPRGAQAAMARALKTSKGYLCDLALGKKASGSRVYCSGRFAARLSAYVRAKGFDLRTGPLCGTEDA